MHVSKIVGDIAWYLVPDAVIVQRVAPPALGAIGEERGQIRRVF